jgi:hypothetical protein
MRKSKSDGRAVTNGFQVLRLVVRECAVHHADGALVFDVLLGVASFAVRRSAPASFVRPRGVYRTKHGRFGLKHQPGNRYCIAAASSRPPSRA